MGRSPREHAPPGPDAGHLHYMNWQRWTPNPRVLIAKLQFTLTFLQRQGWMTTELRRPKDEQLRGPAAYGADPNIQRRSTYLQAATAAAAYTSTWRRGVREAGDSHGQQ